MTTRKANAATRKAAATAKAAERKNNLTALSKAARDDGRNTNKIATIVKALLGSTAWLKKPDGSNVPTEGAKEARRSYCGGYVAGRLVALHNLTDAAALKAALAILDKPGAKAVKTKADARQTPEEEAVCAAARKSWQRVLDAAGLAPVSVRTGKKKGTNKPTGKGKADAAPKTVEVPLEAAKALPLDSKAACDKEQAIAWFTDHAAMMTLQVERLNQSLFKARKETLPPNLCEAVKTFRDAIAAATK